MSNIHPRYCGLSRNNFRVSAKTGLTRYRCPATGRPIASEIFRQTPRIPNCAALATLGPRSRLKEAYGAHLNENIEIML